MSRVTGTLHSNNVPSPLTPETPNTRERRNPRHKRNKILHTIVVVVLDAVQLSRFTWDAKCSRFPVANRVLSFKHPPPLFYPSGRAELSKAQRCIFSQPQRCVHRSNEKEEGYFITSWTFWKILQNNRKPKTKPKKNVEPIDEPTTMSSTKMALEQHGVMHSLFQWTLPKALLRKAWMWMQPRMANFALGNWSGTAAYNNNNWHSTRRAMAYRHLPHSYSKLKLLFLSSL